VQAGYRSEAAAFTCTYRLYREHTDVVFVITPPAITVAKAEALHPAPMPAAATYVTYLLACRRRRRRPRPAMGELGGLTRRRSWWKKVGSRSPCDLSRRWHCACCTETATLTANGRGGSRFLCDPSSLSSAVQGPGRGPGAVAGAAPHRAPYHTLRIDLSPVGVVSVRS
jgi:hypothetical protein